MFIFPVLVSVTVALYTTPASWHLPWTGHLALPARLLVDPQQSGVMSGNGLCHTRHAFVTNFERLSSEKLMQWVARGEGRFYQF